MAGASMTYTAAKMFEITENALTTSQIDFVHLIHQPFIHQHFIHFIHVTYHHFTHQHITHQHDNSKSQTKIVTTQERTCFTPSIDESQRQAQDTCTRVCVGVCVWVGV